MKSIILAAILATSTSAFAQAAENEIQRLSKAALSGEAKAQYELGIKYSKGDGVPADKIKAYKWLHKAAEQGYTAALMARYEVSRGMSQEEIAAAKGIGVSKQPDLTPEQARQELLDCYTNLKTNTLYALGSNESISEEERLLHLDCDASGNLRILSCTLTRNSAPRSQEALSVFIHEASFNGSVVTLPVDISPPGPSTLGLPSPGTKKIGQVLELSVGPVHKTRSTRLTLAADGTMRVNDQRSGTRSGMSMQDAQAECLRLYNAGTVVEKMHNRDHTLISLAVLEKEDASRLARALEKLCVSVGARREQGLRMRFGR